VNGTPPTSEQERTRRCAGCGLVKKLEREFHRSGPRGYAHRCRDCRNTYHRQYHAANVRRLVSRDVVGWILRQKIAVSKAQGVPCSISRADIEPLPDICPVLGIPIGRARWRGDPCGYSIDRIDNERGYVPGNVRVVSARANRLKSDARPWELRAILAYVENTASASPESKTREQLLAEVRAELDAMDSTIPSPQLPRTEPHQ